MGEEAMTMKNNPTTTNWFGKNCEYLCAQWEGNETTDGPNFKDYEPVLVHCTNPDNKSDFEGNCSESQCPKKKGGVA